MILATTSKGLLVSTRASQMVATFVVNFQQYWRS